MIGSISFKISANILSRWKIFPEYICNDDANDVTDGSNSSLDSLILSPIPMISLLTNSPFIFDSIKTPPILFPFKIISLGHFKEICIWKLDNARSIARAVIIGSQPHNFTEISFSIMIEKERLLFGIVHQFLPLRPFPPNWLSVITTVPDTAPSLDNSQLSSFVDLSRV